MTDILDATQQNINNAARQSEPNKPTPTDPKLSGVTTTGPTPPVGSAVGRVEPPLPIPTIPNPPPAPVQKTGSSLDFTSKTEPIQSPPLPIPPPESPIGSGGWSPEKAQAAKKDPVIDAPIANIPQYDSTIKSTEPKTYPLPQNYPSPNLPPPPPPIMSPPSPATPSTGAATNPYPYLQAPPDVIIPSTAAPIVPPPKKKSKKGLLIGIFLLLAAAIPAGAYFVTNFPIGTDTKTEAVGDLRYLCTPSSCAPGCNRACTANLAGTNIVWDGNNYIVPSNGYAIKNKCYGVDSASMNRACFCPEDNMTDETGSGDTCDLPDVERYFVRGPATIGWDENFCGTQQVDITVGFGNSSFFHSKMDTRPETCAQPSPSPTPPPPICIIEGSIKVYDSSDTDITQALKDGTRSWRTNEPLTVGVLKGDPNADHARFRVQPFGDWINNTESVGEDPNIEFRAPLIIPSTFTGTQITLEVELCDQNNVCN